MQAPAQAQMQQLQMPAAQAAAASYQLAAASNAHTTMPHHPYIAPYSYMQAMQPNFAHHYSAPAIPLHTHSMHPSYMASYPYANATAFINLPANPQNPTMYHANISHLRPPPPTQQQMAQVFMNLQQGAGGQRMALPQGAVHVTQQHQPQQVVVAQSQHNNAVVTQNAAPGMVVPAGLALPHGGMLVQSPPGIHMAPNQAQLVAQAQAVQAGSTADSQGAQQLHYLQVRVDSKNNNEVYVLNICAISKYVSVSVCVSRWNARHGHACAQSARGPTVAADEVREESAQR